MNGGSFLAMAARLSMIIYDLDSFRPLIASPEYDPPLRVYSDRMLASEVPSQSLQSIAGGATRSPSIAALFKALRIVDPPMLRGGPLIPQ